MVHGKRPKWRPLPDNSVLPSNQPPHLSIDGRPSTVLLQPRREPNYHRARTTMALPPPDKLPTLPILHLIQHRPHARQHLPLPFPRLPLSYQLPRSNHPLRLRIHVLPPPILALLQPSRSLQIRHPRRRRGLEMRPSGLYLAGLVPAGL